METVTLTIDGRAVTVEKGKTVLQAAIESGISVPYYCYHPGIGIDGSCRVCVVKIEKMPKLQTSCSTICTDGMVVQTRTPDVIEARAGVFEFLLINHPLDCPVCDKGGECPLQDFSYTFGPDQSRMDLPRRTFDGEGVKADVDFGPTLMLNRNRCILCTRCVRFMRDVEGDAQINIIDRGYGSEIATFREEGVHSLVSGNLMDVCPVGAITTKDYRFKSRPWDNPQAVDTICTLCSKGCNTTAWLKAKPEWAKGARLIRFTPRLNTEVNDYWMCDIGRFDYHWIEGDNRLRQPLVRDSSGTAQEVPWREMFSKLGESLASVRSSSSTGLRFLLSAHASHEELFLFRRLAGGGNATGTTGSGDEVPAITMSWRYKTKDQPSGTKFRVPPIDAPNVNGARLHALSSGNVGDAVGEADVTALRRAVESGRVGALYVFDSGPADSIGDTSWIVEARRRGALRLLIVQGVLLSDLARAADFVLPGASYVEKEASYTNDRGRLQGTARVIPTPGEAMEDWQILIGLAPLLGATFAYASPAQIRADIAAAHQGEPGFAEIASITFGRPLAAKHWLQASNPSERWKWDFMFQDLPPVKGAVDPLALPLAPGTIPLREVKG
jgi:NADH-quinone oxidoreductase subunit G